MPDLKTFLKAIGYRSSKSDRLVLKSVLIFCGVLAVAIGIIFLIVMLPIRLRAKRDSAALDLLLSTQQVDRIEFISPYRTNLITGADATKLVTSLQRTNRATTIDWTKQQVQHVRLLSGTNEIWLSVGEDGTWQFGDYEFRLRSQ